MAHLHVVDSSLTSSDRGPHPAKAKRLRQLRRRRNMLWNRAKRSLERRHSPTSVLELYEIWCLYDEIYDEIELLRELR